MSYLAIVVLKLQSKVLLCLSRVDFLYRAGFEYYYYYHVEACALVASGTAAACTYIYCVSLVIYMPHQAMYIKLIYPLLSHRLLYTGIGEGDFISLYRIFRVERFLYVIL